MYKVVILSLAAADISSAAAWYKSKKKGLGQRFILEVRAKILLIRKNPKSFPIRYGSVHTSILNIFPFMIHYSVLDQSKTVVISAVFHTSLSPENWKSRGEL